MAVTTYKHFVPPVPLNPDYEKNLKCILIENLDQLKESFKKGYVIAWDTETTGLNPVESEIVGFSYSYDGVTGYYCPVKHFDLALGKPALDLFYQALKDSKLQLLYNARFDIRMMEYSGYDMSFLYPKDPQTKSSTALFIDVMNQVWLSDTNIPLPSLKSSTLHFLGYQPPKFLETLGDEQNFQYVPAKDAYTYACFTADTLIQTKHGLKQISELELNVDLIKTSDGYRRLLNVLDQGVQKVIRVTTPIGTSFTCTPDHKFAMEIDHCICWVEAKDLDKISFHKRYCGGQSLYEIEKCYTPSPMVMDDGNACKIEYLDEPQQVYDLTIDDEHNFFLQCGLIAHNCLDAINTFNLFKVTYRYYKESGLAARMDNQCVYIIGQLEKQPLNINTEYLVELRDKVYNRVLELEQEIYSLAGHQFKIGSNRELTQVFLEQGIDTGERTKAGDMKTGIELLNLYLRNHPDCTLLTCLIEYKEQFKFYNSYLKTLVDIAKNQDTVPPRFSYKLQSVPCLTDNNLVFIKGKGIVSILEVKEQDEIWTQYGFKRVLWNNSHKTDKVIRVFFSNGLFIEGTPHHPILVNKGTEIEPKLEWVTLEAVEFGECVVFNHHSPTISDCEEDRNYLDYMEYLGFLTAPYIEPSVENLPEHKGVLEDFNSRASSPFKVLTSGLIQQPMNLMEMVTTSSPSCWVSYIQGLLYAIFETQEARKWNTAPLSRFIIRSATPVFLTFLMNMLFYIGIPSSLSYDDETFFLEFRSIQSLTLLKSVIISEMDSQYLLKLFEEYNPSGYYIEYADASVTEKEIIEKEVEVYDIEVEDVHEYCANGVVTHNTGRLATGKDGKNTYFAPINLQCLEENTLIKTERGNIPIKNVTENDLVWTGTRFVPCKPLGSKQKECFKIKTLWGEIEASLEHRFLTLNIYDDYKIEWHTLAECISCKLPLVKDPQSQGIQFDDLYNHPAYSVIGNLRKELDLDRYRKVLEFYKDYKFDIILDCSWQFWKEDAPREDLVKTVYDLYVPEYNQFTANGFIVHNSLPKPHSIKCYARKATPEEIENKQDVLGWMFSPDHPEWSPGKVVEGMDQNLNVRAAFLPQHPEDGDYVISCDMSGEELRVVTNLFKEESWARIINAGGDLHHANSDAIFGPENYTKETRKRAKCISGKSLIFTTRGIKKLEDLCNKRIVGEPQPIDYIIATPEGLSKATHFIYNGKRETRIIHFKDGTTLEATPDHIVQSKKVLRKVGDLCVGDVVDIGSELVEVKDYQDISLPFITGCKLPITEDIAYLLGAILGDGSLDRKTVKYLSIDPELIEEIKRIVHYLNLSDSDPYYEDMYRKKQPRKIPVTYLNCGSKRLLILLKCLGINKNSHKDLIVPEIIFRSPSSVRGRFLRGLFDTDGWVADSELAIGFCSKSLSFTQDIHYLLLSLGILNTVQFSFNKVYQRDYYKIRIAQVSSRQFLEVVGFYNNKKRERLLRHLDGYKPTQARILKKEIVKIEESISEVFDLTVDNNSHLLYANGFIVHNCASFGMLYGQEYRGFQRKFPDMSLDEAKEFMIKFKRTIPHIVRGQDRMVKEARRTGTFYSGFGRPRRVKHYLTSPDYKDVAFGERTVKNSPIQGTAADVLKLELIRLWDNIFTEYPDVKWIVTIHDEIDVSIPRRLAYEVIPKMIRCMTVKMPDWLVTLDCSLSAGPTLGTQFEMSYNFETKEFEPKWEEDTRKESKVEYNEESLEESLEESEETHDEVEESVEEIDSKMFDF